jgi:Tfp pilus assembly protein PilW
VKEIIRSRAGLTTVELLSAALCATVVLSALYGFYREQLVYLLSQETRTATLEDARGALDIMVRELKNAGSWGAGAPPQGCKRIMAATATLIRLQADLNGDGDCDGAADSERGEDVTYDLSNGTDTCPGMILRRNTFCLVANVKVAPGEPLFTYFNANDGVLAQNPPLDSIKRVQIRFSVEVPDPTPQAKKSGRTIRSTLASSVEFRNPAGMLQ